ncbi:MAG: response regulator transcription factor [Bacteroidetes bacterium]|nr:response regulator transcription factor [Bacteroidota bacterium]MBT3749389.1 response regulator transcription factor [Bacteroidota bacterium]MBT4398230.1 response regulator transcription factor [Bacteroidota bacterium]MBT4409014.1 response regulator transcription factor [Bacteroidota bacterium]MBT5426868.1 response regulator transcription factor [Bacteroidota bacterium]
MPIRIIIADDHQLFREGVVNLLSNAPNIDIVGQAENGKEAISLAARLKPDIIIMDIGMPEISGIDATRILKEQYPSVKVLALSMHADKHYIKGILEAGGWGYLLKNCTYNQLIEGITTVYNGKKYLDGDTTEVLIESYIKPDKEEIGDPNLSDRENEILKLIAEGKSNREIADTLFISIKTVGTHKQHILEKLELSTTGDLIRYCLKKGIITL